MASTPPRPHQWKSLSVTQTKCQVCQQIRAKFCARFNPVCPGPPQK